MYDKSEFDALLGEFDKLTDHDSYAAFFKKCQEKIAEFQKKIQIEESDATKKAEQLFAVNYYWETLENKSLRFGDLYLATISVQERFCLLLNSGKKLSDMKILLKGLLENLIIYKFNALDYRVLELTKDINTCLWTSVGGLIGPPGVGDLRKNLCLLFDRIQRRNLLSEFLIFQEILSPIFESGLDQKFNSLVIHKYVKENPLMYRDKITQLARHFGQASEQKCAAINNSSLIHRDSPLVAGQTENNVAIAMNEEMEKPTEAFLSLNN